MTEFLSVQPKSETTVGFKSKILGGERADLGEVTERA